MKKVFLVGTILFLSGLSIVLGMSMNRLALDYDECQLEYNQLMISHEELATQNKLLVSQLEDLEQNRYSFVQNYHGMKYPVESGIRRYIGEEPFRVYPNSNAPYMNDNRISGAVELINEVGSEGDTWCLVLDSKGASGYVHSDQLIAIDEDDEFYSSEYRSGNETLGDFRLGDRIETLIGSLDRDYYLAYENGRIYVFPEYGTEKLDDPSKRLYSGIRTLHAFVDYTNHVSYLRTNSPEFALSDGHKVGDKAEVVLEHYSSKFEAFDISEWFNWNPDYAFDLGDGTNLGFWIDTEAMDQSSVIVRIELINQF